MRFSETLATIAAEGSGLSAIVGEDWSQGRAVYGGLVAALGNEAMRRLVPTDRPLRCLETVFAGPLPPGKVTMQAEILRVGKVVSIAAARLYGNGELASTVTGIYGADREVLKHIVPTPQSEVPGPHEIPEPRPFSAGAPAFLHHFQQKFAEGGLPASNLSTHCSKVYLRHVDEGPFSESHAVALFDCIPPPILQTMPHFVPASSLTWTLEFIRHDYSFPTDAWWRMDTEVKGAGDGYSQEQSLVLDPNGQPAAFSRQLVAVFG